MADTDWTDDELRAALVAYRQMRASDLAGKTISPTAVYRKLMQGPLANRTEGAIGRRMSNISAVFLGEGLPIAERFKGTLGHVGVNVSRRLLQLNAGLEEEPSMPTADQALLKARARQLRGHQGAPPEGVRSPKRTTVTTTAYCRDPAVVAHVLDRANGVYEACGTVAPFKKDDGDPFLEVHHVVQLAEGGPDTIDNAIAACPNCHRRLHHSADRSDFRRAVYGRCSFLVSPGERKDPSAPE